MQNTEKFDQIAAFLNNWPWLSNEVYGNTIGAYLSVIGTVFLVWLIAASISWVLRTYAHRLTRRIEGKLDDMIIEIVHRSITFILVLTTLYFGIASLSLPEVANEIAAKAVFILFTLKIARELDRFSHFCVNSYLKPFAKKQKSVTKTFLLPLSRVIKFIIWTLAILLIIGNLGYNISSLLAGLGVGGLAFALAAQETLSNSLGSLAILTDQPFILGDYIKVDDIEGTVTDIGLRSTRIRTINQNYVSIPNKVMAAATIINYSQREAFNVDLKIGIDFNTSSKKIQALIKDIQTILKKDSAVVNDTFRINVTDFGEYAIELTVFYYINDVSSYARSISLRERVNLKIKEAVEKKKIDIPYPTQSLRIENATDFLPTKGRRKVK